MSLIHSGPSAGKEIVMYCGEIIKTRKNQTAHFQTCAACQEKRREIRVQTCKDLVHTEEMRQAYSQSAKKTAARSDMQQQRTERLKNWRVANPEKLDAIRAKAHASPKRSKMEMWLEPHLNEQGFIRNTRMSCGVDKIAKQVDFIHKPQKIVIEVDGPWHFLPIRSSVSLRTIQQRDRLLEQEIMTRGWRLIRLSMECFRSGNGELVKPSLNELLNVIHDKSWQGILCYGSLYEQVSWDGSKVMIWK
jgi:very-short-patch-repair endonuclease